MRRPLAALVLLAFVAAGPALAKEIVSGQAAGLTATLYQPPENSGLASVALITETRHLTLPKGPALVRFDGVAAGLIPQTARLEGLKGDIRESIFSYALFDSDSVLWASLGQPVTVVRTPPKGGEERQEGTLVSDQGLYSLKTGEGIEAIGCGTTPARLELPIPNGLRAVPALSMSLQSPGGEQDVRLSYLTEGLNWKAAYVARQAKDGRHMTLEGRMVVTNSSDTSFHDLPVRFVAGKIERLGQTRAPGQEYRWNRRHCWKLDEPVSAMAIFGAPAHGMAMSASIAAGSARDYIAEEPFREERLGDLKLYRMPRPITIAAHQTKLFTFLPPRPVTVTPVYRVNLFIHLDQFDMAQLVWRLHNRKTEGLGVALPRGTMTFYGADGGYLGEDRHFRDLPAEGEAELSGPQDSALLFDLKSRDGMASSFSLILRNQTAKSLSAEIAFPSYVKPAAIPRGVTVQNGLWLLTLPPGKTRVMAVTLDRK